MTASGLRPFFGWWRCLLVLAILMFTFEAKWFWFLVWLAVYGVPIGRRVAWPSASNSHWAGAIPVSAPSPTTTANLEELEQDLKLGGRETTDYIEALDQELAAVVAERETWDPLTCRLELLLPGPKARRRPSLPQP